MKIVLVNNVFASGSTGNIVKNLFEEFNKNGHDAYVIFGRGKKQNDPKIIKKTCELESKIHHFFSLISGNMYGGMFFSTNRIKKEIKHIKPDVVNLHCINGYFVNIYHLLKWLAKNKIKTVLTMHAEFMMTGGCGYTVDCNNHINCGCKNCEFYKQFNGKFSLNATHKNYIKLQNSLRLFRKEDIKVTCVSPWLKNRFLQSPLYKNIDIDVILNPVDGIFFNENGENPYKNSKNILYVTPDINDYVKYGWLIKDVASKRPDLNFTIVCSKDVDFKFENKNINYVKGGASKEKLRDYYHYADGTILLSKRETFSMVVAESLVCGTPVYGFKSGGPETIGIDKYCKFVDFGELDLLCNALGNIKNSKAEISKIASDKYSLEKIANNYVEVYKCITMFH